MPTSESSYWSAPQGTQEERISNEVPCSNYRALTHGHYRELGIVWWFHCQRQEIYSLSALRGAYPPKGGRGSSLPLTLPSYEDR